MKKMRFIWVLLLLVMIGGCDLFSNDIVEEPSAEKKFIWNAMNYWYYWQGDTYYRQLELNMLADELNDDRIKFYSYLNKHSDAEAVFESLLHPDDDFSFFIEDYEEYQDEQEGIYAALGFNYGFYYKDSQQTDLVGYVRYVIPGSPAEEAGLERLDLFTKVDGTTITVNNYLDLLTNDSAHDLTLAEISTSGGSIEYVDDKTVTVESREVIEDPIYTSEVVDTSGVKIGYLMYNSFQTNSHQDLNNVFTEFKNQGVNEVVLDLRYNGGGSVLTSQLLSSLISGLGSNDKYATLAYNEKRSEQSRDLYFLDKLPIENDDGEFEDSGPINSIGLSQLYVLTSSGTASASEAVINSLNPYIDVTIIGLKTVGKDEGSLTLYDKNAPYTESEESDPNPDHKKAIQPIVTKIINSQGEDYPNGFKPDGYTSDGCSDDPDDNCVNEITLDNLLNKPKLGSPEEPLFSRAIDLITGQQQKQSIDAEKIKMDEIKLPSGYNAFKPHKQGMYVEPFMIPTEEK